MKKIYSDGYTVYSNPSDKGGYVLTNSRGTPIFEGCYEKLNITNNEMELQGIAKASEIADFGTLIITDSFVAISWIKKGKCKARPDLSSLAERTKNLIITKSLGLKQVPREINKAGIYIENKNYEKSAWAEENNYNQRFIN